MLSVTEDVACSKTALKTRIPRINKKSKKQNGVVRTAYNSYKVKWLYVLHKSEKETMESENKRTLRKNYEKVLKR